MKNTIKMFISFCFGGVTGGAVTYFLLKKKFDARVDAEVQSVKDLYSSKNKEVINSVGDNKAEELKNLPAAEEKEVKKNIRNTAKNQEKKPPIDYANYYSSVKKEDGDVKKNEDISKTEVITEKKPSKKNSPVVISPDEFETEEDYTTIYLTYYSDGVLADEMDNVVKIESTIGKEALKHFGDYEDDILHVRADKGKIYYEVTKDNRTYAEIAGDDGED